MPSISPALLSQWIQPDAVVAVAGLLMTSFRGLRSEGNPGNPVQALKSVAQS